MEPRSFERGENLKEISAMYKLNSASMEPRSFERGESRYQNPFKHTEL